MIRTLPPRGRAVGLVLLAAVALSLLAAVPAAADGELRVSVPQRVAEREPLRLTPDGLDRAAPLQITITDVTGAVGTWRYSAALASQGEPLSIDLSQPDSGSSPHNGPARVEVAAPAGAVAVATTTIDRSPPTPSLRMVVRGQRVGLTWDPVAAPGAVTYKLERIATGGAWTIVEESQSADGFTDRGLEPGRYRYRLTAGVPASGEGTNWSIPSATQVRIAAPAPAPSATPRPPQPTAQPAAEPPAAPSGARPDPAPRPRRQERPRSVAATGTVRGPVAGDDAGAPQPQADSTPMLATADEPAVDGAEPPQPTYLDAVATPEVAAPAAATSPHPSPAPAPPVQPVAVTVPPAGSLAVSAATRTPPDPVSLLSGVLFLLVAAGVVARARRRAGHTLIPAWVGRR